MSNSIVELPEYSGGSCVNSRCGGSTKTRVLSLAEIERMYPVKDKFDWWPAPPQATHVCTVCGFAYNGVAEAAQTHSAPPAVQMEVDLDEWDWDVDQQYDNTVRENVKEFVRAAPDDASADEIVTGIDRYVTGADEEFARGVMAGMDDYEGTAMPLDRFMDMSQHGEQHD